MTGPGARPRIAVIGAGVVGLAMARELAIGGADVTVIDQAGIGAGTSGTTYAWVNSNGKHPDTYHALNASGMHAHASLQDAWRGKPWFVRSGTYEWATGAPAVAALHTRAHRLRALGYPAEQVTPQQLREHVPAVRPLPDTDIWAFPTEGYVHPSRLLTALWTGAREHGARLRVRSRVIGIDETTHSVRLRFESGEPWEGEGVVSAVGRWSAAAMSMLGLSLPMIDSDRPGRIGCGYLATTTPIPGRLLTANLITPSLNVHPDLSGGLLLQAPDLDDSADPANPPDPNSPVGREIRERARRLLDLPHHMRISNIRVGQRSRPADGLPAVGYVTPRVYLVVTHSGITLAPALGALATREILTATRPELLSDFHPERLLGRPVGEFAPIRSIHTPSSQ